MDKVYLCIDLKSFYASCECVKLGLDPFTTNLVVADPSRGKGAICLAITPALKELGIRNRCRLFEIPDNINYITALPKMKDYIRISAEIYAIYLKYIAKEDILVYSIDECFVDATSYLKVYGLTVKQLARKMINDVYESTGICATCGIGSNLFLAKVALDITAKHAIDHMGILDEESFKKEIWHHQPITDVWNIGPGIAKRLAKYGVYDLYGITTLDERILYKEFGVNAEFLIDHAHGVEPCTISEIHNYKSQSNCLSNSQILFTDYNYQDAELVMKEMIEINVLELVDKGLVTNHISIGVGYSKNCIKSTGGSMKIEEYTNSYKKLNEYAMKLFYQTTDKIHPIRQISIGFGNVIDESFASISFFTDIEGEKKEHKMQETILSIKKRYGKSSIIKGMDLQENATTIKRNKLIGGHNGE